MATPSEYYRRLREMADKSAREPSPMVRGVDMSPAMIAARLRELADVSALCVQLVAAGRRQT